MREREKPSATVMKSDPQSGSASKDDSGSGSKTESDNHSPPASDFTVKPIVFKPENNVVMPSKKTASAKPVAAPSSGSKRPAETKPSLKNSKKKKVGGDDEDKIRRLKKKYQAGEDGEDPVFSKPYELKCFELCKKTWGSEA
ncbi:hypothetical protein ACFX15_009395 [Malus domestica]